VADPLNPQINVNPSPKQRFVAVKAYVDAHRELMQRPDMQRAFDYALAQMFHEEASVASDGNSAAAGYYRLAGAQRLAALMKELAESRAPAKRVPGEKEMPI